MSIASRIRCFQTTRTVDLVWRSLCAAAFILVGVVLAGAQKPGNEFAVTGAELKADVSGQCPVTVKFTGYITTNGPGIVRYTFARSDGATGPVFILEFKAAGTQDVETTWTVGGAGGQRFEGWEAIKILSPNRFESSHEAASFGVTCGAPAVYSMPEKKIDEKEFDAKKVDVNGASRTESVGVPSETQNASKQVARESEQLSPAGLGQAASQTITDLKGSSSSRVMTPTLTSQALPSSTSVAFTTEAPTIYVADKLVHRIIAIRDMNGAGWRELRGAEAGTFREGAPDSFHATNSVAVDQIGRIYVADGDRVVRVDNISGANWRTLGGFRSANGIFVDSSYRIYVADTKNNEIVRVNDMNGAGRVTLAGSGGQSFLLPMGVYADNAGRVYVADTGNHRVVRVNDMTGAGWISCCGAGPDVKTEAVPYSDQLIINPFGITLDARGRIYVTSASDFYIRDREGRTPLEISPPDPDHYSVIRMDDISGAGRVSFGQARRIYSVSKSKRGVNEFASASGIALDGAGHIYVADPANEQIIRTDDMTGTGRVEFKPARIELPLNAGPVGVAISGGVHRLTTVPREDLSPIVSITSTPRPATARPFDAFPPIVRAEVSEDVELRSLSLQIDDGPLVPMPFSRDPEIGTIYYGQLHYPLGPTALWDASRIRTLRIVATDIAGHTGEDRREFRTIDNSHLLLWFDAAAVPLLYGITHSEIGGLADRRLPLEDRRNRGFWSAIGSAEVVTLDGQRSLRFGPRVHGLETNESLAGRNYTIFAVVRRDSERGENYAIGQRGTGCNVGGCDSNSSLHLGWLNDRTIRFGQYFNDLDLANVPAFPRPFTVRSIIAARASATTKYVSLDEPGFSRSAQKRDSALMRPGGGIRLGGGETPGFHFEGDIFEVIVYDEALSDGQMDRVKAYLKAKYRI